MHYNTAVYRDPAITRYLSVYWFELFSRWYEFEQPNTIGKQTILFLGRFKGSTFDYEIMVLSKTQNRKSSLAGP